MKKQAVLALLYSSGKDIEMAKAKKLPSGKWRVLVFDFTDSSGKRHYQSFTADTKSEAERAALKWKYGKESKDTNITVEKAVTDYIDSKAAVLSPATVRGYRGVLRRYIVGSSIASVKLPMLKNVTIQKWVSELSEKVSAKTVQNAHGLLTAALQQNMPDRHFTVTLPYREKPVLNTPTDGDIRQMLQHAAEPLKIAIILSAAGNGALRRGEVCAIQQRDVDRKTNIIRIHADLVKADNGEWIYKDHPKNSVSVRTVSYAPEIIKMLPIGPPDSYVVGLMPDSLTKEFIDLRKELGINCRFHDLRAYCASIMLAMGIPIRYVEQSGGWTPGSEALRKIYSRVLPDKEQEYRDKTAEYFKKFAQ